MALLLAGALAVAPTPSCDAAVESFAAVVEHREVTQLQRRLDRMIEECSHAPRLPDPTSIAPRPVAPQPSRGMGSNVEQWRGLVAAHFPASEVDRALCIMSHESGGNPNARNPSSGAAGLFQVMPFWWDHYGGDRFDPETNVRVAAAILAQQGWSAWSPYKRGLCRG